MSLVEQAWVIERLALSASSLLISYSFYISAVEFARNMREKRERRS